MFFSENNVLEEVMIFRVNIKGNQTLMAEGVPFSTNQPCLSLQYPYGNDNQTVTSNVCCTAFYNSNNTIVSTTTTTTFGATDQTNEVSTTTKKSFASPNFKISCLLLLVNALLLFTLNK